MSNQHRNGKSDSPSTADLVAVADAEQLAMVPAAPSRLPPATRRANPSRPVCVGNYFEPEEGQENPYTDWYVVFNRSYNMRSVIESETARLAADGDTEAQQAMSHIVLKNLHHMLVAWNFLDEDDNPAPQPTDQSSAAYCPQDLIYPLMRAFAATLNPPKAGKPQ